MDPRAAEYERRHPGTGVSEAQAIERFERIKHREDRASHHVTTARVFTMPAMPWHKERTP